MKDVSNNNGEMMRRGRIEVICGSMFSGKTEELIRRMKRAMFARQKVEIFKPAMDTRYSDEDVVSHEGNSIPSTPIDSSASILLMAQGNDVIGIDEAQFFDEHIVEVCNQLANQGIRVIVAGLDLDFKGEPFGPMPQLLAIADEVSKVHAICVRCGALAYVSHRLVNVEKQVLLGEKMEYEPLCRDCYRKALEEALLRDKAHLHTVCDLACLCSSLFHGCFRIFLQICGKLKHNRSLTNRYMLGIHAGHIITVFRSQKSILIRTGRNTRIRQMQDVLFRILGMNFIKHSLKITGGTRAGLRHLTGLVIVCANFLRCECTVIQRLIAHLHMHGHQIHAVFLGERRSKIRTGLCDQNNVLIHQ